MNTPKPVNVQYRVEVNGGLIAAFQGESQGKALERALPELNADGYRVVFMIQDQWNMFKRLLFLLVLVCTLGLYTKVPNWLIIGERVAAE